MGDPLITVIVPVYKVEKYLDRCVNSIRNQTYSNLEILLVDDGSPDRCGQMCDQYAEQDSRIHVIHKENGGLSSARNAGLDIAKGTYVGFVDSDDWIEQDMYETLYNLLVEGNAQIAACGLQCDYADGSVSYFNPDYPRNSITESFTTLAALREVATAEKITNSVCDKLFAINIFEGHRMKEGIVNEDAQMMHIWLEQVERVIYTPVPYYHYIMTESSITRGAFKLSRFTEAEVSRERMAYYQEKYPEILRYVKVKHIDICLNIYFESANMDQAICQRNELKRELRSLFSVSIFLPMKNKVKIKYLLFLVSPYLYSVLMNIRHRR